MENREGRSHSLWSLTVDTARVGWRICKTLYKAVSTAAAVVTPAASGAPAPARASEGSGRAADIDIGPPAGSERLRTMLVVCAFSVAIAAAVGFMFVYWTGGSNLLLGGTIALALGGLGSALVLWTHLLMGHTEATEPRESLPSPAAERKAVAENFNAGERQVHRRKLLTGMSTLVLGTFAALIVSMLRSFGKPPGPSLLGAIWKRGQRLMTLNGKAVSANMLKPGDSVTVFPEDSIGSVHAQTVLIRVQEEFLRMPKGRAKWTPMGYVAYSRVCTHAGCPVGEFESATDLLLCPCHQSTFNVLDGAQPTGGPAARPLPQLPLYVAQDGTLRAAGDFSAPPGPGFWRLP
jgi:ubiquinol-cytochrome c reductase iron-sulfur subunit